MVVNTHHIVGPKSILIKIELILAGLQARPGWPVAVTTPLTLLLTICLALLLSGQLRLRQDHWGTSTIHYSPDRSQSTDCTGGWHLARYWCLQLQSCSDWSVQKEDRRNVIAARTEVPDWLAQNTGTFPSNPVRYGLSLARQNYRQTDRHRQTWRELQEWNDGRWTNSYYWAIQQNKYNV